MGVNANTKKKAHPLIKVMTHLVVCIGLRPCIYSMDCMSRLANIWWIYWFFGGHD